MQNLKKVATTKLECFVDIKATFNMFLEKLLEKLLTIAVIAYKRFLGNSTFYLEGRLNSKSRRVNA